MKFKLDKKNIPYFIIVLFGIVLFVMGIFNHYYFRTVTYDYGNYNFAFWDYSHFRISPIPIFRGNFLQDHFSFTLMYFVPIYWLLNWITGSYTLILIQNSLIIIAAWYSYKLVRLKTENIWLTSGVLIYYFALLGRYTSFSADVNLAILSSCFIPIFLYYFEIKKYLVSFFVFVLSLFSRENIPIWFIFIFVVLIIQHRKEKTAVLYSIFGIVLSVAYFVVLFKVFIPAIETPGVDYALFNYSALGATPGEALMFVIRHPFESIKLFFVNHLNDPTYDGVKMEFYLVYLISGGFVLFYRPQYLIWFIPIVAQKVLNDSYIRWGIATYYSIEVVTLLPLSVFLTLAAIKHRKVQNVFVILVCLATIATTVYKLKQQNNKIPWTLNPSKVKVYDKHFFEAPFNIKKVNQLLNQIPSDAKLSASNQLVPHLAQRQFIYFFPTVNDADYIAFSVFDDNYLFSHYYNEKSRNTFLNDSNWQIIQVEFPVFLLQKKESLSSSEVISINRLWEKSDTITADFEYIDVLNKHVLLSNNQKADTLNNISNEQSRSLQNSIKLTAQNPYSHSVKINDIDKIRYIEISVWCYCKGTEGIIVSSNNKNFYQSSNEYEQNDELGWRKIVLMFWVPEKPAPENYSFYLWNSGQEPVYFDDLQIIKIYKN